jgi:hypothetical protein
MDHDGTDQFIGISASGLVRVLAMIVVLIVALHIATNYCWVTQRCGAMTQPINDFGYMFDMNSEGNVPTWYSVVQLLSVAFALGFVASCESARRRPALAWWGLVVLFAYMSLDEATDMHGLWAKISGTPDLPGVTHSGFSWVIPGAILVTLFALLYARWLWRLPPRTRNLIVLAGTVFVAGGLGLELVGALVVDTDFLAPSYLAVSTLEELFEIVGIMIMLYAILSHIADQQLQLAFSR